MKDHAIFLGKVIAEKWKYMLNMFKNLSQNHWANFDNTWHKASFR